MKGKIITKTYLRDVSKHQIKLYLDEDDFYVSVKKLIKVDEKFIIHNNICVMDDNFYIIEVIPKNENYSMRLFLDDKKNPLEYYFDICKNNSLDFDTLIPYYDDLYLDVTVLALTGEVNILDEDELEDALENGDITVDDYNLAIRIKEQLLLEINSKSNKYMNIDYDKYLF